jgi:putative sigma-54 modulation protein
MKPSATSDDIGSKIILQGIHMELTPSLQTAIRDKLAVVLRHNPFIIRVNVRLQATQTLGQNHSYRASAQIEIGGPDLNASAEGAEAYDVIDELVAKLTQLLERRHGLRKDRRNHPHEIEVGAEIPKVSPPLGDEA